MIVMAVAVVVALAVAVVLALVGSPHHQSRIAAAVAAAACPALEGAKSPVFL